MKMKKHVIIVLFWTCLLLSPGFALAQYDNSTVIATYGLMADLMGGVGAEANIDMQGYDEQDLMNYGGRNKHAEELKFYDRLSNFGDSDWLPPGAICLTYSDEYKWVVHDYWVNPDPIMVGSSNCLPIELIRCYNADYYHILGTGLVAYTKRPEQIFIRTPPKLCPPN